MADCNDRAVGINLHRLLVADQFAVLVKNLWREDRTFFAKFRDRHALLNVDAVNRRVIQFALTRRNSLPPSIDRHVPTAHANHSPRHINCRISRADDRNRIAEIIRFRVAEIIYREMHVAERFAFQTRAIRTPNAGSDKHRLVAVRKKIVEMQRAADCRVRTNVNAQLPQFDLISIENHLRQTKRRNAVAHHAADFIHALEDRNIVAAFGEFERNRDACRSRADDRHALTFIRLALDRHLVEISIGNVILDARNIDRRAAPPLNAIAFALIFMIAHERAHDAERIVVKKHAPGFRTFARQKQSNHLGNICLDRATFESAERLLAL